MGYFKEKKLVGEFKDLIAEADQIETLYFEGAGNQRTTEDFQEWRERALHDLSVVFGETSEHRKEFASLDFDYGGDPWRDLFLEELARAKAILRGCLHHINTYGIPKKSVPNRTVAEDITEAAKSTPRSAHKSKFAWVFEKVIVPLALIPLTLLGKSIYDSYTKQDYRQVEVSFYNWLDDYDNSLMPEYDKLVADWASRGVLNSGGAIQGTIDYFRGFRRKRDNRIDSFLVAYALAGGHSLNLQFRRKLLIDVGRMVIKRWGGGDAEFMQHLGSYRLDTL